MKIYLAGPDVFLEDFGAKLFEAKKALCSRYGFEGVAPSDGALNVDHLKPFEQGIAIYEANAAHMRACDAVIANMTPFRGISMDVGTAFEMGFMAASGKPVLGYTNVAVTYTRRAEDYYANGRQAGIDPYTAGTFVESFDMADNLMMVAAVHGAGFKVVEAAVPAGEELTALGGFEACLKQLQEWQSRRS